VAGKRFNLQKQQRHYYKNKLKENKMKRFTLLSLLALVLVTSLLGCNTARGAGKDISDSGKHIQDIGK
jgi:predicted small secreted protein